MALSDVPQPEAKSSEREDVEAQEKEAETVIVPGENDVICGQKGKPAHTAGWVEFRRLVEFNGPLYKQAYCKDTKQSVIDQIIGGIHGLSPPGRFLEKSSAGKWRVSPREQVVAKCSHALWYFNGEQSKVPKEIKIHQEDDELSITPGKHDVICGQRGRPDETPGFLEFWRLVESHRPAYQKETSNNGKRDIISRVFQGIRNLSPPGRFLEKSPDGKWKLASKETIYSKCRTALASSPKKPTESTNRKRKSTTASIHEQDCDMEQASEESSKRAATNTVIELHDDCGVKRNHLCSMLHVACRLGAAPEVIQVLMDQDKTLLRTQDKAGCLPLHLACKRGQAVDLEVVRLLVYAYPSGTTRSNRDGNTPLDEAKKSAADEAVTSYIEKWQGITSTFLPGEIAT